MKTIVGKLVLIGESEVGKTSVVVRFVQGYFNNHVTSTIGAAFYTCSVPISDSNIKLHIWDTAGEERFRAVAPLFYRNTQAAILVFDVTNRLSFIKLSVWLTELYKNVTDNIPIFVVGNKCDRKLDRQIFTDEAHEYATSIGADYFETSAVTGDGVSELFQNVSGKFWDLSTSRQHSLKVFDEKGVYEHATVPKISLTTKPRKLKKCCRN